MPESNVINSLDLDSLVASRDLLQDLNNIVDYVVGNQAPEEVSAAEIGTLPELFSYLQDNPENLKRLEEAVLQMDRLIGKIEGMKDHLTSWKKMVEYLKSK